MIRFYQVSLHFSNLMDFLKFPPFLRNCIIMYWNVRKVWKRNQQISATSIKSYPPKNNWIKWSWSICFKWVLKLVNFFKRKDEILKNNSISMWRRRWYNLKWRLIRKLKVNRQGKNTNIKQKDYTINTNREKVYYKKNGRFNNEGGSSIS